MKKSKYIGSSLDDFLEEEGLLEHCESIAAKRAFVMQFEEEMRKCEMTIPIPIQELGIGAPTARK